VTRAASYSPISLKNNQKITISKLALETGQIYQPRNQLDYQFQFRLNKDFQKLK